MTCGVLILIPFRRARFLFGLVRKWTSEAMVAGFSGTENTPLGFRVKVSALCWSTKNLRLAPQVKRLYRSKIARRPIRPLRMNAHEKD